MVCDLCGYEITNETKDPNADISVYLDQPCPTCGANLLTKKDLKDYRKVMRLINRLNWWFSWVTIFIPKNKKQTEGSVKVHDGIKINKE